MYKVITNKSGVTLRTELVTLLNLEWDFKNYAEAYDFYVSYILENASHVGTICATRINRDIQLVEITEEGTKLHYRLHLSN
jgi:hypothetical protein